MPAVGGGDVDSTPCWDSRDDALPAVPEELGEVCAGGVVLVVPEARDGCNSLTGVVERPSVDWLCAAWVRVGFGDLHTC